MSTTPEEREFIKDWLCVYRELPALWNLNCKEYYDRYKKIECYNVLLKKYQERFPNATVVDLKKKLNSLRSNYRKVLRKMRNSEYGDPARLWYFDEMSFLQELETDAEITSPATILYVAEDSEDNSFHDNATETENSHLWEYFDQHEDKDHTAVCKLCQCELSYKMSINSLRTHIISEHSDTYGTHINGDNVGETSMKQEVTPSSIIYANATTTEVKTPTRSANRKRKKVDSKPLEVEQVSVQEIEYYDFWGKTCSRDLQKMDPVQQIYAKKAISDIMMLGQLGRLHYNSVQVDSILENTFDHVVMKPNTQEVCSEQNSPTHSNPLE